MLLFSSGSHDETVLFCLGVSIGIISSLIASGREVKQLKEVLKHTQNLVQDLQEELEMKDSMTVKQLANENNESQDTCDNSFHYRASNPHLLIHNVNDSTNNIGVVTYNENTEQSSESMSKIEAELEAELERLGLNMNPSGLPRRLSDFVEDRDIICYFDDDSKELSVQGLAVIACSVVQKGA
ncbi:hypothetical protein OIU78_029735 [Salix suchowensis]|nr:hypothetical protein OIU78_029735 [Salix suchowensis]